LELCRRQINPVRFRIKRDRSRTAFCFQCLHNREFVGRFFFHDRGRSIAAGCEHELRRIIKRTSVGPGADRHTGNDFSRFGIEHHEHFVVTRREQSPVLRIECDPARFFTRRDRPTRHYFVAPAFDHHDFAFIFQVAIDPACIRVDDWEFRSAAKRNCCDGGAFLRINYRCRVAGVIENLSLVMLRVVSDSVRTLSGIDF
jgi:hypothetical protein